MKFILAPDKYKTSITGIEFCAIVSNTIESEFPNAEIINLPLADGGDGMLESIKYYLEVETIHVQVNNAVFKSISAEYVLDKLTKTAYIEMSEASGLRRIQPEQKNLFETSTFGTGELILHALLHNAKRIVLGLGGSATNDAGIGMASALGFRFLDENEKELKPIGENLNRISEIDDSQIHPKLKETEFVLATDVQNKLFGKNGAAYIFGLQKTKDKSQIKILDEGLQHLSKIVTKKYNTDFSKKQGSGAAGGLGFGGLAFLNADLISGIDLLMNIAQFDKHLKHADWVITGEGQLDAQTASGKTIAGILNHDKIKHKNIKIAAFCGSLELEIQEQKNLGLAYATSILNKVGSLEEAMSETKPNLEKAVYNFLQLLKKKT